MASCTSARVIASATGLLFRYGRDFQHGAKPYDTDSCAFIPATDKEFRKEGFLRATLGQGNTLTPPQGAVSDGASPPLAVTGNPVEEQPGVEVAADEEPEDDEPGTVLRLLAPVTDTTATVRVTASDALQSVVVERTIELTAGIPTEAELGGLEVGQYTVEVTGEVELLASVWQATGSGEATDFAWYMPAPELGTPSTFATPAGPEPQLTLANVTDTEMTVAIAAIDGATSDPSKLMKLVKIVKIYSIFT